MHIQLPLSLDAAFQTRDVRRTTILVMISTIVGYDERPLLEQHCQPQLGGVWWMIHHVFHRHHHRMTSFYLVWGRVGETMHCCACLAQRIWFLTCMLVIVITHVCDMMCFGCECGCGCECTVLLLLCSSCIIVRLCVSYVPTRLDQSTSMTHWLDSIYVCSRLIIKPSHGELLMRLHNYVIWKH